MVGSVIGRQKPTGLHLLTYYRSTVLRNMNILCKFLMIVRSVYVIDFANQTTNIFCERIEQRQQHSISEIWPVLREY